MDEATNRFFKSFCYRSPNNDYLTIPFFVLSESTQGCWWSSCFLALSRKEKPSPYSAEVFRSRDHKEGKLEIFKSPKSELPPPFQVSYDSRMMDNSGQSSKSVNPRSELQNPWQRFLEFCYNLTNWLLSFAKWINNLGFAKAYGTSRWNEEIRR